MRTRLDIYLVNKGLVATRAQARDAIKRGTVSLDGAVVVKASTRVGDDAAVHITEDAVAYVSRGGFKLAAALDHFGYSPKDRVVLDVGASTGGFTDVCLQRGAQQVYAVDVGSGQLHERLRMDARVISLEKTDIRTVGFEVTGGCVEAIVADVSFMSATQALPPALALASPAAWLVALIKPQFEAGPKHIGKGGIVKDDDAREAAIRKVRAFVAEVPGWFVDGVIASPIAGGSGNIEYLIGARRHG